MKINGSYLASIDLNWLMDVHLLTFGGYSRILCNTSIQKTDRVHVDAIYLIIFIEFRLVIHFNLTEWPFFFGIFVLQITSIKKK